MYSKKNFVLLILLITCLLKLNYVFAQSPVLAVNGNISLNDKLSLNGEWQFTNQNFPTHKHLLDDDFSQWDTLTVPGNWDTTKRYANYSGKAYYQRAFTIPEDWKDKNIRLKFDAVYQTAHVWLNGQYLGKHVGGYTPFEFNVSENAYFEKANSLVVMADNSFKRGAWWAWGGISRDVTLFADNKVRVAFQHVSAIPDFEKQRVVFSVKYKLQNYSDKQQGIEINSEIGRRGISRDKNSDKSSSQKEKQVDKRLSLKANIPANAYHEIETQFIEPLSKFELWSTDKPNLYQLSSTVSQAEINLDTDNTRFGIRKFEVKGEQFFLNNQPIRTIGVNRVHDHPKFGNTEPAHLIKSDLDDIKSLGSNFARLMHAPYSKTLLNYADEMGYLLVAEIPVWGDDDPNSFAHNPLTKTWLKEMIERDFNHPSIVGWSVGNELRDPLPEWGKKTLTPKQYAYVDSMLDYVAVLDPTRLKTYVSITAYSDLAEMSNEPFEKVDFISINSYGNAVKKVVNTHDKFPGKPIFLSEIGIGQIGGDKDSTFDKKLIDDLLTLKQFSYLTGFSVWSYNDYRSNYKGTPKSGYREWGIVDHNRNKKAAYFELKKIIQAWHNNN
ncbi:glycoside hydrolase family 2 protein [Paraglaciecola sp.]|uniref:glycoside hydrolase family 2 protein n=1 Tax=Paraglaciecola sp. TaxID=1920173 RepID=UPI003F4AD4F9